MNYMIVFRDLISPAWRLEFLMMGRFLSLSIFKPDFSTFPHFVVNCFCLRKLCLLAPVLRVRRFQTGPTRSCTFARKLYQLVHYFHFTTPDNNWSREATCIQRWIWCSYKKTSKQGRFSPTVDVRACIEKGVKNRKIWKEKMVMFFNPWNYDTCLGYNTHSRDQNKKKITLLEKSILHIFFRFRFSKFYYKIVASAKLYEILHCLKTSKIAHRHSNNTI